MASKLGLTMFDRQLYDRVDITPTGFAVHNSENETFTFDSAAFNTLPIVQISSPSPGIVGTTSVTLAGTARDPDGTDNIVSLKYWVDSGAKTTITITPANNVSFSVPSIALTVGAHVIYVEATDSRGGVGTGSISITVNTGQGVQVAVIPTTVSIGSSFKFNITGGLPGDTVHIENTSGKTAFDNQDYTLDSAGSLVINATATAADFNVGANSWSFTFGSGPVRTATLTTTVATGMTVTVDKLNPILYKDEITLAVAGAAPGTTFTVRLPNEGNAVLHTGTITAGGTWSKKLGAFASTWFIGRQITYEFIFAGNQTRQVSVTVQAPTHSFTYNGSTTITVNSGQPLTGLAITNAPVAKDTRTGASQPVTLVDPVYEYEDLRSPGTKIAMTNGVIDAPVSPSPDSITVGTYKIATSTTNQVNNTSSVVTYQVRCYVNGVATNACTVNVNPALNLTLTANTTVINSGQDVTFTIGGYVQGGVISISKTGTAGATDALVSIDATHFKANLAAGSLNQAFYTFTVSMTAYGQMVSSNSVVITINPVSITVTNLGNSTVNLPSSVSKVYYRGVGSGGGGGKAASDADGRDGQPGGDLVVSAGGAEVLRFRAGGGGSRGYEAWDPQNAFAYGGTSYTSPGEKGTGSTMDSYEQMVARAADGGGTPNTWGGNWLFTLNGVHYGSGGIGETGWDDRDARAGGSGGGSGEFKEGWLNLGTNRILTVYVPPGGAKAQSYWPGAQPIPPGDGLQGALQLTY